MTVGALRIHRSPGREARVVACSGFVFGLLLAAGPAQAIRFDLGHGVTGSVKTGVSIGMAVRTEGRDPGLIGRTNLAGQYSFCEDKRGGVNCSGVPGNAAFLALPGAGNVNQDNGDLNYGQWQLVSAPLRIAPELKLDYAGFRLDVSAYAFYDVVNENRDDHHPNNFSNDGFQPATTPRPGVVKRDIGADARLGNAYLGFDVPVDDDLVTVKIGRQLLGWGKAITLLLNGVAAINPPDATILHMPGAASGEFLIPEPLIDFSTDLSDSLSAEAFYQFAWIPARIPPDGSFFSSKDTISDGGTYAMALFGKYREDPHDVVGQQGRLQGNLGLLSKAGRTLSRTADRDPDSQGEFGLRLSYFARWLNNTSFSLYFHNLHSRLPFGSFIAARKSCLSDATNAADVVLACRGFANVPGGEEPVPLDSVHFFADYPENIRTFGFSFSTNLGAIAWAGEVAFRPNQPLQIQPADLAFAALQPMLPKQTISLVVATVPSRRVASPDYVETVYRHETVQPQQLIPGYARLETIQYDTSFVLQQGRSANPFGANQFLAILELGVYQVMNLPSLDTLQLAAPGAYYHHSAGVDGSGTPNAQQQAAPADSRLNPHYQAGGFATRWSYGFRLLTSADYEYLIPGVSVAPQLALFDDLGGISPLPTGQFVSGRKQVKLGLKLSWHNHWQTLARYTWIFGGGSANLLRDRDYFEWSLSYDF